MNVSLSCDWVTANQELLGAEFERLGAHLGDGDLVLAEKRVTELRARMPSPPAIDALSEAFNLSRFERDLLLLAAGVEMSSPLARTCAAANGNPTCAWATFGLALSALPEAHWSAITPMAPLRQFRLLEPRDTRDLTAARLQVDERVLHFIGGLNYLDHQLQALLEPVRELGPVFQEHRALASRAAERLLDGGPRLPTLVLSGDDEHGQEQVAALCCEALGLTLFRLNAVELPDAAGERAALRTLWQREALLLGSALLIAQADAAEAGALGAFVRQLGGMVIVSGRNPPPLERDTLRLEVNKPRSVAQREMWRAALTAEGVEAGLALDTLASQYRLSARSIQRVAAQLRGLGAEQAIESVQRLCSSSARYPTSLVQRIEPRATFADLVLPPAQLHALEQVALHARHRITVHHDWGFAEKGERGLGIASLFWGDSGTGKTMAAEALAGSLGLVLFRIDLSAVVSKYIGETEKNLRQVFDCAEETGAVLLFDEADALFGKRSEVKDSHDRYANIEVSYLLQRMEAYRGLAVLTTNHKATLDAAFHRRLRFVVHFPFPDAAEREAIWQRVFPSQTPLGGLDYQKLARLVVAGGTIRNIALSAAFLAAEAGTPITMDHVLRAAHLDAAKREETLSETETRGWV